MKAFVKQRVKRVRESVAGEKSTQGGAWLATDEWCIEPRHVDMTRAFSISLLSASF